MNKTGVAAALQRIGGGTRLLDFTFSYAVQLRPSCIFSGDLIVIVETTRDYPQPVHATTVHPEGTFRAHSGISHIPRILLTRFRGWVADSIHMVLGYQVFLY